MNCELHDIARIFGLRPAASEANDRVVRCMAAVQVNGEPGWELDRPIVFQVGGPLRDQITGRIFEAGERVQFTRIRDKYLRPIRGGLTGDEGSDEAFPGVDIDAAHAGRAAA